MLPNGSIKRVGKIRKRIEILCTSDVRIEAVRTRLCHIDPCVPGGVAAPARRVNQKLVKRPTILILVPQEKTGVKKAHSGSIVQIAFILVVAPIDTQSTRAKLYARDNLVVAHGVVCLRG